LCREKNLCSSFPGGYEGGIGSKTSYGEKGPQNEAVKLAWEALLLRGFSPSAPEQGGLRKEEVQRREAKRRNKKED